MILKAKFVGSWLRNHIMSNDAGQNMVETALIIGTITLVIVAAFLTTGIELSMANLAGEVACSVQGGAWTDGVDMDNPGSCA